MLRIFLFALILMPLYFSNAFAAYDAASHPPLYLHGEKAINYAEGMILKGNAAWYGKRVHGNRTASGKRFNMHTYTAAHRTLPLGTVVRVTNLKNKKTVVVTVTDRGPLSERFAIDLSYRAARDIHMIKLGVVPVSIKILRLPKRK